MQTTKFYVEITTFEGSMPSPEAIQEILLDELKDCEAVNVRQEP
jgi:hypothetical protein